MTHTRDRYKMVFLALGLALFLGACQKKCQQPATEKFKTITGQEWRLIETNDPDKGFKGLNNTTFLIWSFSKNYTGSITKVLNNDKYDTPVFTLKYQIDPEQQLIRMLMEPTDSGAGASTDPAAGGTDTQAQPATTADPVDYTYDLGRDLTLTDAHGRYYHFVPFQGIVDPDNTCTF